MNKAHMTMLSYYEFSKVGIVTVQNQAPVLPCELEKEISRLWQLEQKRLGHKLFNGKMLSATSINVDVIDCNIVEYRYLIAQKLRPELFDELQIQPVAVSGLLHCADGIVFGRRASFVTHSPESWELVPSGGLDLTGTQAPCRVDFIAHIFTELKEEVGIDEHHVVKAEPFCLIQDNASRVIDIGIRLFADNLTTDMILEAHNLLLNKEYSELIVVPYAKVADYIQRMGASILPVSKMLLQP